MLSKCRILTIVILLVSGLKSAAQFQLDHVDQIPKIKSGTTFIAMEDPLSAGSKPYRDVIEDNWTFSKIEFIKYSEIEDHLAAGNSFFTVGGYETSVSTRKLYSGGVSSGIDYSHTHLYLELWAPTEKYLMAKKKKDMTRKDRDQIARIELFTDFPTLMRPNNLYQTDYSGEGHIRNWSPGILKNYVQNLMGMLEAGKEHKLYDQTLDSKNVKVLQDKTLYVPDYVLTKFNKFTGDETKKHQEKDIFEDYKYKYSLVSMDDLNAKILDSKTPVYYLVYIKSSTDKFITVMNSQTGEAIYSAYYSVSYNIGNDDLEDLSKKIAK